MDDDAALGGEVDAVEVEHEGAFAGAVGADEGDFFAGLDAEVEPVEGLVAVGVAEDEAFDLDEREGGGFWLLGGGYAGHARGTQVWALSSKAARARMAAVRRRSCGRGKGRSWRWRRWPA